MTQMWHKPAGVNRLALWQAPGKDADHIAAHHFGDVFVGQPRIDERLRDEHQLRCVEAGGGRAIEIRTQPDMIDPDQIPDMDDGARDGLG